MSRHFIAIKPFSHQVDCFTPGEEQPHSVEIKKADILTINSERKYIIGAGWYFLIGINDHSNFFISVSDLEKYYTSGSFSSVTDIELNLIYWQYKLNQALDDADELQFGYVAKELTELESLKQKLKDFSNSNNATAAG
ncbi:hypothetical protein [Sediminibacillus massiliensis]|uniref:hypothetical protein n=1 Tax=Sediminibacillus massiliensis TaxID=1926277 RepID=UPI000988311D|nr:hypothetical protein [Sediminibacillus massiliensis]